MSQISGLTVRQYERAGIRVPVEFIVGEAHATQVQFSPASGAIDSQTVAGEAVDISAGGMGLEIRHFLPRSCVGTVRVFDPRPIGIASDGSPIRTLLFEHAVRVRRVYLIDRDPKYAVGVAFVDPAPDIDRKVADLLIQIGESNDSTGVTDVTPRPGTGGRGHA